MFYIHITNCVVENSQVLLLCVVVFCVTIEPRLRTSFICNGTADYIYVYALGEVQDVM